MPQNSELDAVIGVLRLRSSFASEAASPLRTQKLMVPRVVITGLGVVSPNGIGKEAFCLAVLEGKSGVKRISRWDPSSLPVHIAGEIPEFDELAWIDARERKHVSRVVPLGIAACAEAIKSGGLDPASMSMEEKREI